MAFLRNGMKASRAQWEVVMYTGRKGEWGWAAENEFWGEGRKGRNQVCYGILVTGENVKYAFGSMTVDFRGNVRAGIDFRSHHHLVKIPIHGIKWDYLKKWSEPWHATWANIWGSLIHRQGRDRDPGWSPEASKLRVVKKKKYQKGD